MKRRAFHQHGYHLKFPQFTGRQQRPHLCGETGAGFRGLRPRYLRVLALLCFCSLYLWPFCGLYLRPFCVLALRPFCGLALWPFCGLYLRPFSGGNNMII